MTHQAPYPKDRQRTTPTIPPPSLMMSVVKGGEKKGGSDNDKNICHLWGRREREGLGRTRGRGGWAGEGESSGERREGEVEVRGWLKAMGRARGVREGDARGKRLEHNGTAWNSVLGRREQGGE